MGYGEEGVGDCRGGVRKENKEGERDQGAIGQDGATEGRLIY